MLAEEAERGGLDAVVAVAEVGLVEVQREDLVLRVRALDQQRRERFLDLARVGLLPVQEAHARELLGDRAAALPARARPGVGQHRRADAHDVDAVVLVEPLVLDRDDRLADVARHLLERHLDALLLEDREHRLVGLVEQRRRLRHVADRRQRLAVRQRLTDVPGKPEACRRSRPRPAATRSVSPTASARGRDSSHRPTRPGRCPLNHPPRRNRILIAPPAYPKPVGRARRAGLPEPASDWQARSPSAATSTLVAAGPSDCAPRA